jgi:hypothetical protein
MPTLLMVSGICLRVAKVFECQSDLNFYQNNYEHHREPSNFLSFNDEGIPKRSEVLFFLTNI